MLVNIDVYVGRVWTHYMLDDVGLCLSLLKIFIQHHFINIVGPLLDDVMGSFEQPLRACIYCIEGWKFLVKRSAYNLNYTRPFVENQYKHEEEKPSPHENVNLDIV